MSALHVAWGSGSSFPFASRGDLADAVIGSDTVPSPPACYAVAAALAAGSTLLIDAIPMPERVRRAGLGGLSLTLGGRAMLGWFGQTEKVSPGSNSVRFRRLDRRVYAPTCAALAAGALAAVRRSRTPAPAGPPRFVTARVTPPG